MRHADDPRQTIDRLLSRKEKLSFNLFYLIADANQAFWVTEHTAGHISSPLEEHREVLERFITGMVDDLEHRPMDDGEAEGFAQAVIGSGDMFLWEEKETVVSMAQIVHQAEGFARISTVYTDKNQRGRGYAGMLLSEITKKIWKEGQSPVLYTEAENAASNAAYRKIGYSVCGELKQYLLEGRR